MFTRDSGCVGLIGLILGVTILTGGWAVAPGANTTLIGAIILAAALVLTLVGAWEELASKRQEQLQKEADLARIERLARLKEQGVLSEEEFAAQKQKILAEEADAGIAKIRSLTKLRENEILTEVEFVRQKREILAEESLTRLVRLKEEGSLTEEEFDSQKKRVLDELGG